MSELSLMIQAFSQHLPLGILLITALISYSIARRIVVPLIKKATQKSLVQSYNLMVKHKLVDRIAHLLPVVIFPFGLPLVVETNHELFGLLTRLNNMYFIMAGFLVFDALLNAGMNIYRASMARQSLPIRGLVLAGGVGIDLTSAEAVIHYDRWWNPAREEQATARVHRMGQKDVVQVFRLITRGTLEEKIHSLIGRKTDLADTIIQEDEAGIIKQMDRRELAELLRLSP